MGRVFDADFFYHDDPRETIPIHEDFSDSLGWFEDAIEREINEGLIDGGIVFGSVALGSYSLRSDLDCLVVRRDFSEASADAVQRIILATDPGGIVPVGVIAHTKEVLASGRHEIDEFFGDHLSDDGRRVYGHDPAEYIRFAENSPQAILASYIRHKKRSVSRAFSGESTHERTQGMQRTLELPLAIGRKTLRVLETIEGSEWYAGNTANKSGLSRAVLALYEQFGLDAVPAATLQLDREYTEVLKRALDGEATLSEYSDVLHRIKSTANDAYKWLDDFDQAITERLTLLTRP